ncbi:MAG TPA: YjjG family noncanonical pyrimidine nucleotidase [Anaerolineaceae bacterium]|nr:YjjG family noncanonical pyrimidine nucleotidase [Anaerolineaceae bacterium]
MPKPYKLILWDLDNTLFDFDKAEEAALQYAMRKHGLAYDPTTTLEAFRIVNLRRWEGLEQKLYTKDEVLIGRFEEFFGAENVDSSAFNADYLWHLGENKAVYPEAESVVQALHSRGYIQSIVTNGAKEVQDACFHHSPIAPFMKTVVISEEVGVAKPDPRIFEIACENSGWMDKASTLMVGDSLSSDIAGGKRYGVDTCYFNQSGKAHKAKPTYEICTLPEILTIL